MLQGTLTGAGLATLLNSRSSESAEPATTDAPAEQVTLYVNPVSGADQNSGMTGKPLRTLAEAARRVNQGTGSGPVTIMLSEGVHAIGETTLFKPERRNFSSTNRLTIRAEVLPGDPQWNVGRMPTLVHTLPLSDTWNGRADPLGGAANGMLIETSHVSVRGLRILGLAMIESPQPGLIRRLYAVSRLRKDLVDLRISQCLFVGEETTTPNHVGIIANGNGVIVENCVFRGLKISAVFWTPGSSGHAMRQCVCDGLYGSAVWTAGISSDFEYRNNVVLNSNYVWTSQGGASALADAAGARGQGQGATTPAVPAEQIHYQVVDSLFAGNRRLASSGTGARLEYKDIDPSFLEMVRTKVVEPSIAIERDSTSKNYLHPVAGSEAAAIGAGLFAKPAA
jgi:hypothetical protein